MLTLVEAAQVAQHSRDAIGGECSFVHSRDRRSVVASSEDGAVSEVGALGEQADLGELAGLFQVTVGDAAFGIVEWTRLAWMSAGNGCRQTWGTSL